MLASFQTLSYLLIKLNMLCYNKIEKHASQMYHPEPWHCRVGWPVPFLATLRRRFYARAHLLVIEQIEGIQQRECACLQRSIDPRVPTLKHPYHIMSYLITFHTKSYRILCYMICRHFSYGALLYCIVYCTHMSKFKCITSLDITSFLLSNFAFWQEMNSIAKLD